MFLTVEEAFQDAAAYLPEVLADRGLAETEAQAALHKLDTLLFDCPLWTEDRDFFGCGVPLWTTDRVEIYLK
jgi:hypothetical protein